MDDFVLEYFSVERFRKAYASKFNPMTSKDSWPRVDLGYKIKNPKLRRKVQVKLEVKVKVQV
jgi:hypothetical protein